MKKQVKILIIIVIAVALIGLIGYLIMNIEKEDSRCAKVQEGCCPCTDGGNEICILSSELDSHQAVLDECSERNICAAVYKCEDNIVCKYSNGECIKVEM